MKSKAVYGAALPLLFKSKEEAEGKGYAATSILPHYVDLRKAHVSSPLSICPTLETQESKGYVALLVPRSTCCPF